MYGNRWVTKDIKEQQGKEKRKKEKRKLLSFNIAWIAVSPPGQKKKEQKEKKGEKLLPIQKDAKRKESSLRSDRFKPRWVRH